MAVASLIYLLFILCNTKGYFTLPTSVEENNINLTNCVSRVLYKFHTRKTELTIFDMDTEHSEVQSIVKAINFMNHSRIIIKTLSVWRPRIVNEAYMILADNAEIFIQHFNLLQKDSGWNPMVRFFVIIKDIEDIPIQFVFKEFLYYHVNNVIVIDGRLNIFSYFPFANSDCGRKFDGVHKLGHCHDPELQNLFPEKLMNGLNNCTFRVLATHFPPYVIESHEGTGKLLGSEQCTLELLARMENFKLKYEFLDIVDEFSTVNEDMEAIGPLRLLQTNTFDILCGGMFLIENRARPFTYLYGQTAFLDEMRVFVRAADKLPEWKIVYIEFNNCVWVTIFLTFIVYGGICTVLMHIAGSKRKGSVILKLWDNLLMHDSVRLHVGLPVRCVLIFWVWFTFLLNSYYQTSLTSLVTTTVNEYQVKTMEDLQEFEYTPCVSPVVQNYMRASIENPAHTNQTDCLGMLSSLMVVNDGYKLYTITPLTIYETEQSKFVTKEGKSTLYVLPMPLNKLLTSLFFYKGFPRSEHFHKHTLVMRETGLIAHCLDELYTSINNKEVWRQGGLDRSTSYVVEMDSLLIPYAVLGIGYGISGTVFALEHFVHRYWAADNKMEHAFKQMPGKC